MFAQQIERSDHTPVVTPTIVVIGIGNDYRMDDAAGLLVARNLRKLVAQKIAETKVRVLECTGGSFELMDLWAEVDHVVLVDAVCSGTDPGTIYHLDAHSHPIPSYLFHYSTHGFNLADTIELARLLNKLPTRLMVFGIEGLDFEYGEGLSDDVAVAIEKVVKSILEYIDHNVEPDTKQSGEGPDDA